MYVALFGAHRKTRAGLSMLALVLVGVGTAIFVANNVALPMLELSREYGLASSDSQRLLIESAASALTARGAHGSMGVFAGFLLPSLGTLVMSVAMLRGGVFSRLVAYAGIVGISLLLAYVVGTTFALGSEGVLMAVAAPGGLLMIVWNAMVARRLLQLRAGV